MNSIENVKNKTVKWIALKTIADRIWIKILQ